jgi:hypothetical protein
VVLFRIPGANHGSETYTVSHCSWRCAWSVAADPNTVSATAEHYQIFRVSGLSLLHLKPCLSSSLGPRTWLKRTLHCGVVSATFSYTVHRQQPSVARLTVLSRWNPRRVTSYPLTLTLRESVTGGAGPHEITLIGSASADGTHMSHTYFAPAGSCTTGDNGVWTATKN